MSASLEPPTPVKLTETRRGSVWKILLFSAVAVFVSVLMVRDGHWFGWLSGPFFAFLGPYTAWSLRGGPGVLHLHAEGVSLERGGRAYLYAWSDVSEFRVGVMRPREEVGALTGIAVPGASAGRGLRTVVFDFAPSYEKQQIARKVARGLMGQECALPETYGLPPDELAALLNRWRAFYT